MLNGLHLFGERLVDVPGVPFGAPPDRSSLSLWAAELVQHGDAREQVKTPPTGQQLRAFFLQHAAPYVGFGLVDNSLMVLSGEAPRVVAVLGGPGVGRTTQAASAASAAGWTYLHVDAAMDAAMESGSAVGQQVASLG